MAAKAIVMKRLLYSLVTSKSRALNFSTNSSVRLALFGKKKKTVEEKEEVAVVKRESQIVDMKGKTKLSFVALVENFEETNPNRRGHVEFIYAALKLMKEFGVEKDVESYKRLLEVFPKGKMVPKTSFQIEFIHFPLQQKCAVTVLDQMNDNGVIPDEDIQMIIMERFGYRTLPMRKFARMNYWMPKFRYASPWILPKPVPDDPLELAMLAIKRIASVDLQTKVEIYETKEVEDSLDNTWIVSGQSPQQQTLLLKHPKGKPLYIDGAFRIWLRNASIAYFVLRCDPNEEKPKKLNKEELDDVSNLSNPYDGLHETSVATPISIHEQEDSTIFAVCATGSSSRDSLLSWLRFLQKANPILNDHAVIFTLKAPTTAIAPVNFTSDNNKEKDATTESSSNVNSEG
ncbi:hypothetical protein CHUAL_003077 [Chamberlinius hualienensis]